MKTTLAQHELLALRLREAYASNLALHEEMIRVFGKTKARPAQRLMDSISKIKSALDDVAGRDLGEPGLKIYYGRPA